MRHALEPDFALGRSGARVRDLRCRLIVLPAGPDDTPLKFDEDFWTWWGSQVPKSTKGTNPFGNEVRASAWGAVWCLTSGGESWDSYLSLSQGGVLDVGIGHPAVFDRGEITAFRLVGILGRVWTALDSYRPMIERSGVKGPFEISLGLRDTRGSVLGHLATGWADIYEDLISRPVPVPESAYLGRWERDDLTNAEGTRDLTYEIGGWIENCWGSWRRRFLTRTRDGSTEFDWSRFS
jgi:hypothetical protein